MRNQAIIELIGYVAGEPEHPKVDQYPDLIKFSMGVTRRWKKKKLNGSSVAHGQRG